MRVAAVLALLMALPAGAQEMTEAVCAKAFDAARVALRDDVKISGVWDHLQDGQCVFRGVRLKGADGRTDFRIDTLRVHGGAMSWLAGEAAVPDSLALTAEGTQFTLKAKDGRTQRLLAAPTAVTVSAAWDPATFTLRLHVLDLDFPGANSLSLSGEVGGVNLTTPAAMQMSVAGFQVISLDLDLVTHGLFESLAMPLLANMLPEDGSASEAIEVLRQQAITLVAELPVQSVPNASKQALGALLHELPNPSGRLTVAFRADPGFGAARLTRYVLTGPPATMDEAAPLFQGVTLGVTWAHGARD